MAPTSVQLGPLLGASGSLPEPFPSLPTSGGLWEASASLLGPHWGPQNEPQESLQSSKKLPKISKQLPQK